MAQFIITGFSDALKKEFKVLCAKRGKSMKDEIIKLIKEEVKKGTKN